MLGAWIDWDLISLDAGRLFAEPIGILEKALGHACLGPTQNLYVSLSMEHFPLRRLFHLRSGEIVLTAMNNISETRTFGSFMATLEPFKAPQVRPRFPHCFPSKALADTTSKAEKLARRWNQDSSTTKRFSKCHEVRTQSSKSQSACACNKPHHPASSTTFLPQLRCVLIQPDPLE